MQRMRRLCLLASALVVNGCGTKEQRLRRDIHEYVRQCDVNHDGRISLAEFLDHAHRGPVGRRLNNRELTETFTAYDLDHDGFVTEAELNAVGARRVQWPATH